MKKRIIILSLLVVLFIVSCESATIQDLSPVVTDPTYTANVEPVISASCTGCHSGGSQYPNLNDYASVKDASANGNLICKIEGGCGTMPPSGKMPQATVDMINLWAVNGYKN